MYFIVGTQARVPIFRSLDWGAGREGWQTSPNWGHLTGETYLWVPVWGAKGRVIEDPLYLAQVGQEVFCLHLVRRR